MVSSDFVCSCLFLVWKYGFVWLRGHVLIGFGLKLLSENWRDPAKFHALTHPVPKNRHLSGVYRYTHMMFSFFESSQIRREKQNTEPWTAGHCSFVTAMCMDGWLEEELKLVFKWISYIYIYIYIHHEISINKWLEDWPTKKWPKLPSKRWEILQISWKVLPIIVQAPAGCQSAKLEKKH